MSETTSSNLRYGKPKDVEDSSPNHDVSSQAVSSQATSAPPEVFEVDTMSSTAAPPEVIDVETVITAGVLRPAATVTAQPFHMAYLKGPHRE